MKEEHFEEYFEQYLRGILKEEDILREEHILKGDILKEEHFEGHCEGGAYFERGYF